jgi:hypothetical protein
MTYAEFCIRLYAYQRIERLDWFKVREIAWSSLIGSHMNPKKLPRSKEQFIPLKPRAGEKRQEKIAARIKQARAEYFEQLKRIKK